MSLISVDKVIHAVSVFDAARIGNPRRSIDDAIKIIEQIRRGHLDGRVDPEWMDWQITFGRIGAAVLGEMDAKGICLVEFYKDSAVDEYARFLVKKNTAYGDAPIRRWGELGTIIRLDSKVSRYVHLSQHPETDNLGESRADTLRDMVGYSVLGYRLAIERKNGH